MDIEHNPNIIIEYNIDGSLEIGISPHNIELNLNYVAYWTKRIINEFDNFSLYSDGYNFDGLYEINNNLIAEGCTVYDNSTLNYRTVVINNG